MSLFLNPWRPFIAIWPPSIVFRSNEFSVLRIAGRFRLLVPSGGQNRNLSVSLELAGKDCDQRKQSQNYRRGARDCQIAPLTLRLHAQMFPRFFKCDFQSPACHKPVNDLLGARVRVGAGKDFVTQLSLVVARDHITNRHWWVPHPVPQGGSRKDQHLFLFAAVPINVMFFPSSVFAPRPFLWRPLTRAFERLRPTAALGFLCRRVMQGGIPVKAHLPSCQMAHRLYWPMKAIGKEVSYGRPQSRS